MKSLLKEVASIGVTGILIFGGLMLLGAAINLTAKFFMLGYNFINSIL